MRLLAVLLVVLALPAVADPKRAEHVRISWLSAPDGIRAGQTWRASFELLDPGGNRLIMENVRPVVVAVSADEAVSATAKFGDTPGRYVADVRFPSPGIYRITLERFDPRDPHLAVAIGPPVAIGAALAPPQARSTGFPWPILIGLAVPALSFIGRTRVPPARSRARPAAGAPPEAGCVRQRTRCRSDASA